MDAPFPNIDPAEAWLADLAGLDMTLARHVHACCMSTTDPDEVANLSRAYQRISRSVRQSLALLARLRGERERRERDVPPPPPKPLPPTPAREHARIAERRDAVRDAAQRVVWSEYEYEPADSEDEDHLVYLFDLLDEHLHTEVRNNTFGLKPDDDAWVVEPLDDHIVRVCHRLGLPEAAARAWRTLPEVRWAGDEDAEPAEPAAADPANPAPADSS